MQHQTIRRVLLAGAFTAAAAAGMVLADQAAAHADDKPAVVEQPGGLLDHTVRLPDQAAARAKAVVEQAAETTPEPTTPAEPEPDAPADEPAPVEPTPADDQAPVEDRAPAPDPTADVPPLEVPVVETPPAVEPAPVVDTPPVEAPPAEVPPVDVPPLPAPAPAPSTEDEPPVVTLPTTDPAPVTAPEVGALPVTIGPVPATAPPAAPVNQLVAALTSTDPAVPAYCADDPDAALDVNRDPIRDLIASLTDPAATPRARPAPGCPSTPDHPAADGAGSASVAATGHTAGPQCLADVTGGMVAPALARLEHARARSAIPSGRATHLDPRPA